MKNWKARSVVFIARQTEQVTPRFRYNMDSNRPLHIFSVTPISPQEIEINYHRIAPEYMYTALYMLTPNYTILNTTHRYPIRNKNKKLLSSRNAYNDNSCWHIISIHVGNCVKKKTIQKHREAWHLSACIRRNKRTSLEKLLFKHEQEVLNQGQRTFFFFFYRIYTVHRQKIYTYYKKEKKKGYNFQSFVSIFVYVTHVAPIHCAHHMVRNAVFLLFSGLIGGHVEAFINL